jgi:hypothetical protein
MPPSSVENRVVLVEVPNAEGEGYQIKRLKREGTRWLLTSDNPAGPTIHPDERMLVIARLERAVPPSDLAPPSGAVLAESALSSAFGLHELQPRSGRYGGHLFLFLSDKGEARDRVNYTGVTPHPSETAFVLAKEDAGAWLYIGVARQTGFPGEWAIPDS